MKARFEWIVNILSLILVVGIGTILVRQYYLPARQTNQISASLKPNSVVPLPDMDWAAHRNTLVMALSVGCHWCEESGSFYRELLQANGEHNFYTVAILPQPKEKADAYLSQVLGIHVDEIRLGEFHKMGIAGTPTLILADGSGRIRSTWIGKLSEQKEAEVFTRLGIVRPRSDAHNPGGASEPRAQAAGEITAPQVLRLLRTGSAPIIDVRPRADYRKAHVEGALNIPSDELEARASHEIPPRATVMIYCDRCATCEVSATEQGITSLCSRSEIHLRKAGFKVLFVDDDLLRLKQSGVAITGNSAAYTGSTGPS
jgi:Rhodanese-like domain